MSKHKNYVYNLALLVGLPFAAYAAPSKTQKLPCLFANPSFADVLLTKNPYHAISKRYTTVDPVFLGIGGSVSENVDLSKPTWEESLEKLVADIERLHFSPGLTIDVGLYFTPRFLGYAAFAAEEIKAYAAVFEHKPWNTHVSIGKFPIHFGSGASDYPFVPPHTKTMLGVSQTAPIAASLNSYYRDTKFMLFAFEPVRSRGGELTWGFHTDTVFKSLFNAIDSATVGFSYANTAPLRHGITFKGEELPAVSGYVHAESGPVRVKTEITALFKLPTDSTKGDKSAKNSKSAKNNKSRENKGFAYGAYHVECAYQLPLARPIDFMLGYTGLCKFIGSSEAKSHYVGTPKVHDRFFVAFKGNIVKDSGFFVFKEVNGAIGYRHDLRMLTFQLSSSL